MSFDRAERYCEVARIWRATIRHREVEPASEGVTAQGGTISDSGVD